MALSYQNAKSFIVVAVGVDPSGPELRDCAYYCCGTKLKALCVWVYRDSRNGLVWQLMANSFIRKNFRIMDLQNTTTRTENLFIGNIR